MSCRLRHGFCTWQRTRFLWSRIEEGAITPSIGRLELVGADGSLYTVADEPFPQVRRYRVELGRGR
jgi:hypothetical protein